MNKFTNTFVVLIEILVLGQKILNLLVVLSFDVCNSYTQEFNNVFGQAACDAASPTFKTASDTHV